jgi:hypothetical protein
MYFGNGLAAPLLQLMATHPPLAERIRRIDPRFDGTFPATPHVSHEEVELIDPQTLALRRAAPVNVHEAAVTGAMALAGDPAAAVATIGTASPRVIDYADSLVSSLPPAVATTMRDPLGAVATVYALLLSDRDAQVRRAQLEYLDRQADRNAAAETRRIAPYVAGVAAEARLPLVSMALPALKGLSPRQRDAFGNDVRWLIKADKNVTLFEYAVNRLIVTRLVDRLEKKRAQPRAPRTVASLVPAVAGVLSTLAHWGATDTEQAHAAFAKGAGQLPGGGAGIELLPRDQCQLPLFDASLDRLAGIAPRFAKPILEACAVTITFDGKATVEEAELLRIIADALNCPMPPIVGTTGNG